MADDFATQEKRAQVLKVLQAASEPIGPTAIARAIRKPWCMNGGTPESAPVVPILRKLGAVRHRGGKYSAPEDVSAVDTRPELSPCRCGAPARYSCEWQDCDGNPAAECSRCNLLSWTPEDWNRAMAAPALDDARLLAALNAYHGKLFPDLSWFKGSRERHMRDALAAYLKDGGHA